MMLFLRFVILVFIAFFLGNYAICQTATFNCTGSAQSWTVPPCVTSINVVVKGAQGGGANGGGGATVTATLTVTPGQVLQVNVGCAGSCPGAGFNGGGAGQNANNGSNGSCGGGGASGISISPYGLANRLIVAGGGGGMGGGDTDGQAGNGGCNSGTDGDSPYGQGGYGATQTAGGAGGPPWISSGNYGQGGSLGAGGNGAIDPCYNKGPGGGGGGGYYGGGGGGSDCFNSAPLGGGGGGGGSSLVPSGGSCTPGNNTGNGSITITYTTSIPTVSVNSPTICAGQSATLTATVSPAGGTYSWNTGATTQSITVSPGSTTTYSVTYTLNGCSATASGTVTVNAVPAVSVNSTTICAGQSATLTATVSPSGGNYSWNTGATSSSITVSPGSTTTYSVTYTRNGCSATATGTVTVNPLPSATFTYNGNQCLTGNSFNFSNTGTSGGGATYSWTFPSGSPASSTSNNPNGISWNTAGTYTITHSVIQSGCTSTTTQNIIVYALPSVIASGINPLCNGGCTGTVSASGSGGTPGYTYTWSNSLGTGSPKTNVCAGTYTVTVSDANGCTGTNTVTLNNPSVLSGTATATNANCNGVCSGTLSSSGSGGTSPYTYSWSNSLGTGATKSSVCAGTYTVTITDANNCTTTASATVNQPGLLVASAASTNATCNGICNGTLTASATGGTTNYSYSWSNSLGSGATKSGVCAGTYTVTVTDANGCTKTATVTVSSPSALASTATGTNVSCNGGTNGSACVSVSGGTTGYSYSWNNGVQTQCIASLQAGNYTVTVSDANSCTATASVTITQPPALTATTTATAALCNGSSNGSATATPSGGTSPYTFQWNGGTGFQTTQTATGLAAGTYSVTVTGVGGCTTTTSATVNQPGAITATTATTNSTCATANGSATVTAAGGTSPYTYLWNTTPAQTSSTATGLLAGSYTVTITDANNCTNTATATVSSAGAPTATISSSSNVNCFGGNNGNATVTAVGGATPYTYLWSPSGGTAATANGLTAGTFCVNVTDNNNCVASACTTITEPPPLTGIPTGVVNTTCNGTCDGSATTSVSGGVSPYTYSWQSGGTSATKTGLCSGTYNVSVNDANGCGIIVVVTITEPLVVSGTATGTSTSCNGICDGDANLTATGGTSPYTFLWNNGETVEDATSLCAGSNSVTITDANGCTATANVNITEPSLLTLTSSSTNSACGQSNGQACITASGGTTNYSYSWNTIPAQISSCATGVSAGNYTVTVTDANGCVATNTVTVNNSSGGTASAAVNSNATGAGVCNGSATASMTGGTSPYTYLWGNGQTSASATGLCAGSNCVTVTDANGCSDIACIVITEPSAISAVAVPSNIQCFGNCNGSADLTVSGGVSPFTYQWSNGATAEDITNLCAGSYDVTITDVNGNTASANVVITSPTQIVVTPSPNNNNCFGECSGFITIAFSGGTEPYTYLWNNGQTSNTATALCAGNYSVTVTDVFGCTGTASSIITEPPAITLTLSSTNANCGANDGSASVSASGGTTPYSYLWNDSATTASATAANLSAGTYLVTVTDFNNCSETGTVIVNNNSAGTPSATVNNHVSCNGGSNGSACVSISGGTSPYSYSWNNGVQTQCIASLQAGTYSVTITDANCPTVVSITITEPADLFATATATGAGCFGSCNGTTTVNASGGTSPYTYQWNDANFQTSSTATGLCAGNFGVTITDANSCASASSATVTQNPDIVLSTSSTQSTCNQSDASATVTISSGISPFTYLWEASTGNQTTPTATALFSGCYSVTISDGNNCTKVANVCVTDAGSPSVSLLTKTDVSCFDGNDGFAQISVSGGNPPYSYSWNTSPVQNTASAFNLPAGTYTGSMVDSTGCTASVSVTINQPAALTAIISSQTNASCFGSCNASASIVVSGGTSPYSYLWNDINSQTSATATGLCAGTYNVQISDANSCDTTVSVIITEPSAVTASATSTSAFCGTASGSACVTVSGGTSPYTYLWNNSVQTQCIASVQAGNYTVTVTDSLQCVSTANITVGNIASGNATISTVTGVSCNGICDGSATVSMGGSGTSPFTYVWAASANSQTTVTATGLCAGNHDVTITDSNGCTATAIAFISEPDSLAATINTINARCFGECDGSAAANVAGGSPSYSFLWNDPLSQTSQIATGLCAGNYSVTITDANNCILVENLTVGETPELVLNTTSLNANCNQSNGSGCVIASGGTAPYSYLWSNGNINPCAASLGAGTHIVTVTDGNNCTQNASVIVQNMNGPTASFSSQTNINCNGNCNGSATASVSGGVSPYNFAWSNNQVTPTISNLCAGMYVVTITDSAGCVTSASVNITQPATITYNQQATNPSCFGGNNGAASATITGGTTPYSYMWNTGAQTQSIASLQAGNYILTVTDSNNCVQTLNFTLTNPAQITTSMSAVAASCNGMCDGKATVTASNGTLPYTYLWNDANGQTSQQANGLCTGNYSVTITDALQCVATGSATISQPSAIIANINNSGNVSCSGQCNGYAQVSVSGGTPAYTYLWNNNSISQVNSNLCAGNYTVTVTDANNCTQTALVTISQPVAFSSSITGTNVNCGGICDGQAALSPAGGAVPYAYLWSANTGFQNSQTATALCGGNYSVTITDANGCQIYKNITIIEPTPLSLVIPVKSDANCGQNNGGICASVTGGTAPYTYQWNDPNTQTSACASGLYAGCYILNITDSKGCIADTLVCINDIAGPTMGIDTISHVTCAGSENGLIDFNVTGGTTPYNSIQWFNGAGTLLPQYNGLTISNYTLSGGNYTLVVTDAAGCISTLSQTILEPNQIAAAITNTTNISCYGNCSGSATVSVAGGTSPYIYEWNNSQTSPTATGLCAGTYVLTITDSKFCTKNISAQISQPQQIVVTDTVINASCNGNCDGTATILPTGGNAPFLFNWSPNTNSNATASSLCAGNYNITVTDANACTATHSVTINEPAVLTAITNSTPSTCTVCNATASITPSGGTSPYNFVWGTGQSGGNISGLCSGANLVTVSDMNGCSINLSVSVTDLPSPQITGFTVVQPLCNGMSNGSATVNFSGGTSPYSYQWSTGGISQTVAGLSAGTFNVILTDANFCNDTQNVIISQPTSVVALGDITSDTICFGQITQIWASGSGGNQPYTVAWIGNASSFSGEGPHNVSPVANTSYCFTVFDTNNCPASNNPYCIPVTVNPELIASGDITDSICLGESLAVCVSAIGGNGNPYSFQWSNGANGSCQIFSQTTSSAFSITVSDGCSLDDTVQVAIVVNPMPSVDFLSLVTAGCPPLTLNFISNPNMPGLFYQWDFDGDSIVDSYDSLPTFTFAESDTFDVSLTVSTTSNCDTAVSKNNYIIVYPAPTAGFEASPEITSILNSDISFNATNLTLGADSIILWNLGDGTTDTGLAFVHTYNDTGTYTVILTAINKHGCIADTSGIIIIKEDFAIYVPNAFSPNNDGKNDYFFPQGVGINPDNFKMWIFDRWGDVIFETNNVNTPWDGTAHGGRKPAQIGVYIWMIETIPLDGEKQKFMGSVTVYR